MHFLIKIFAEITVKSRPVRKQFIAQLRKNILKQIKQLGQSAELIGVWDNLELKLQNENMQINKQVINLLQNTPGISQILQVKEYEFNSLAEISTICEQNFAQKLSNKTFVVRCKRNGKHPFTSSVVECEVGAYLLQNSQNAVVNLHNPQLTIKLEIKQNKLFVITDSYAGLGGYPLGTIGQSLVLMSGGFDSTVAAYQMLRRGVQTHFIFFNLGGNAHELGVKQVAHFLWEKYSLTHKSLFISVPFEQILENILTVIDKPYMGVVLKRCMLRISELIAHKLSLQTLVTGESISQVSSQTVPNLALIDSAINMLVMRPLLTFHKQEIIDLAEKIGTAEFARKMPEYCGVISVNPTTCGKLQKCLYEEQKLDFNLLEKVAQNAVIKAIDKVFVVQNEQINFKITNKIEKGQMVLDIRHPDEILEKPLNLPIEQIKTIPFYALNSQFSKLDQSVEYLLYCEKGIMSKLHFSHLLSNGFNNVGIYQI